LPVATVVIPAYNASTLIGVALDSVFRQTFTDYEIIVVNDKSADTPELERVLAPYSNRIRYLAREQNGGVAAARNTAIRVARGRYIALLDADDSWEPEYLAEQLAVLEADATLAAIYPNALIVGDHPHAGRTFMDVCPSEGPVTIASLLNATCNVFISSTIRLEPLLQVGSFDENLRSAEDFEMWVRLIAAGHRIGYQRKVLARHLKRRESLSADPINMATSALQVLDKMARELPLSPQDREILARRQAHFQARLELARGKHAFFRLDQRAAVEHLQRANQHFNSWRLRIVCALIRLFPGTLHRLYRLRDRVITRANTSF
jgi:glycosyltransferase involved in cell wall biosynthesis